MEHPHCDIAVGRTWVGADDVCQALVHGADGNDVLVDHTGLGAELAGGAGLDVLLWDETGSLMLEHSIAGSAEPIDADVLIAAQPTMATDDDLYLDGVLVTARDDDSRPRYFDGRFLAARDLTRSSPTSRWTLATARG